MARKTRQQKIIADLRRQLQNHEPVTPTKEVISTPLTSLNIPKTTLPTNNIKLLDSSRLGRDLVKVGLIVGGGALLEIIVSLAISHGYLARWGIL